MLKDIDLFITQNESDANNFISLSADVDKVHVIGNLKFDVNQLYLSSEINEMVRYAEILIFVIPSAFLKEELD